MLGRISKLRYIGSLLVVVSVSPSVANAATVFSDGFEGHAGTSVWPDPSADVDPGAPTVGDSWAVNESAQNVAQVVTSPVTSSNAYFDAVSGTNFLHNYGGAADFAESIAIIGGAGTSQIATSGSATISYKVYQMADELPLPLDGWGYFDKSEGMRFLALDSATFGSFAASAVDITFTAAGDIVVNDGSTTTYANSYNVNAWNDVVIDIDFSTDTYDLTVNGGTVATGLSGAGGDLSQIQSLTFTTLGVVTPIRGGWDDVLVTTLDVPEPGSFVLVGLGCLAMLRRK